MACCLTIVHKLTVIAVATWDEVGSQRMCNVVNNGGKYGKIEIFKGYRTLLALFCHIYLHHYCCFAFHHRK